MQCWTLHRVQPILLSTRRSVSGRCDTSAQTVPHFQLWRRSMRRNCSTVFYLSTELDRAKCVKFHHVIAACRMPNLQRFFGKPVYSLKWKVGICLRNPQRKIEHIPPNRFPSPSGLSIQHVSICQVKVTKLSAWCEEQSSDQLATAGEQSAQACSVLSDSTWIDNDWQWLNSDFLQASGANITNNP